MAHEQPRTNNGVAASPTPFVIPALVARFLPGIPPKTKSSSQMVVGVSHLDEMAVTNQSTGSGGAGVVTNVGSAV